VGLGGWWDGVEAAEAKGGWGLSVGWRLHEVARRRRGPAAAGPAEAEGGSGLPPMAWRRQKSEHVGGAAVAMRERPRPREWREVRMQDARAQAAQAHALRGLMPAHWARAGGPLGPSRGPTGPEPGAHWARAGGPLGPCREPTGPEPGGGLSRGPGRCGPGAAARCCNGRTWLQLQWRGYPRHAARVTETRTRTSRSLSARCNAGPHGGPGLEARRPEEKRLAAS
jgi:hypothetical protein